jgi:hypothetical protein
METFALSEPVLLVLLSLAEKLKCESGKLTQHTEFFQIRKTVSLRGESNKAEVALRRAKTGIL